MRELGVVLLVEDDKNILRTNRRILEQEGFAVLCAETLAEARRLLASFRPDVLVLDVMLPDGNGVDFCRSIRSVTAAPVLFLTAVDEQEDIIRGLGRAAATTSPSPTTWTFSAPRCAPSSSRRGRSGGRPSAASCWCAAR